jgi:hypothetical protein
MPCCAARTICPESRASRGVACSGRHPRASPQPFSPLPPPRYNSYLPHPVGPSYNGYYPGLWSRRSWFDSKWAYPTSPYLLPQSPPSVRLRRTVCPSPTGPPAGRSPSGSPARPSRESRRPPERAPGERESAPPASGATLRAQPRSPASLLPSPPSSVYL